MVLKNNSVMILGTPSAFFFLNFRRLFHWEFLWQFVWKFITQLFQQFHKEFLGQISSKFLSGICSKSFFSISPDFALYNFLSNSFRNFPCYSFGISFGKFFFSAIPLEIDSGSLFEMLWKFILNSNNLFGKYLLCKLPFLMQRVGSS